MDTAGTLRSELLTCLVRACLSHDADSRHFIHGYLLPIDCKLMGVLSISFMYGVLCDLAESPPVPFGVCILNACS